MLWSLPLLASGLLALLRYGFGSLFVVGESIASILLSSTGADIAGTLQRLHVHPLRTAAEAALGLVMSAAGATSMARAPLPAAAAAFGAAAWAGWFGLSVAAAVLLPAAALGLIAAQASRTTP